MVSSTTEACRCSHRRSIAAQTPATVHEDVYNGWKWWHVYCYRCHGTNAVATTLAPDPDRAEPQLTAAEFLKVVRNGVPDKGMQAWDKLLDDKQISQIHLYVSATDRQSVAAGTAG